MKRINLLKAIVVLLFSGLAIMLLTGVDGSWESLRGNFFGIIGFAMASGSIVIPTAFGISLMIVRLIKRLFG